MENGKRSGNATTNEHSVGHAPRKGRGRGRGHIFISYKREDRETAGRICTALGHEGFDVWWDAELQCGGEWSRELDEQLAAAGCVVVLWSKLAVESDWVRHEASHALTRGVYAPCRIEHVDLSSPYDREAVTIAHWSGETWKREFGRLVARVDELMPSRTRALGRWLRRSLTAICGVCFGLAALGLLVQQARSNSDQAKKTSVLLSSAEEQSSDLRGVLDSAKDQADEMEHVASAMASQSADMARMIESARAQGAKMQEVGAGMAKQGAQMSKLLGVAKVQGSKMADLVETAHKNLRDVERLTNRFDLHEGVHHGQPQGRRPWL